MIYYTTLPSPIGDITIVQEGEYIIEVSTENPMIKDDYILGNTPLLEKCKKELLEYFENKRTEFDIPLKMIGTEFQKKVWQSLLKIPYGETRSYKDIAIDIGSPKGCRAVGNANNKNPIGIIVPCHRVIGANGKMVGYAGGIDKKIFLLELEKTKT